MESSSRSIREGREPARERPRQAEFVRQVPEEGTVTFRTWLGWARIGAELRSLSRDAPDQCYPDAWARRYTILEPSLPQ